MVPGLSFFQSRGPIVSPNENGPREPTDTEEEDIMAKKGFKVVVKPDQRHRITTEEEMQMFLHTRLKGASVTKNKKGQKQTRGHKHKPKDW